MTTRFARPFTILALFASLTTGLTATPALAFTDTEKDEINAMVRQYILDNPDIIAEAITELQRRDAMAQQEAQKAVLKDSRAALENNPADPVMGNPKGDVTIVEFFDYQCGYCKKVFPALMEAVNKDGNVRVVMKEFPILSATSLTAARIALAAQMQGKYKDFHNTLMEHKGGLNEETLWTLAAQAGVDVAKAKVDMNSKEVNAHLAETRALADQLQITGTPGFVIGDHVIPGAIDLAQIQSFIIMTREGKKG